MLWFKVARCVIGDNKNANGREEYLRSHGVEVVELKSKECEDALEQYAKDYPERWSTGR
jgi:cytosine/creatinine deaminase